MAKRLFVDMDGTLAEWRTLDLHLDTEEESNPLLVAKKLEEILLTPGYYYALKPMQNMLDAVSGICLREPDIEVFILSCYLEAKGEASPLQDKNNWLHQYLPEVRMDHRIFVPDGFQKSEFVLGGIGEEDYLLDDYTKNLHEWEQAGGKGIKVLNGINSTKGTWKGLRVNALKPPEEILQNILQHLSTSEKEQDIEDREL